jgi:hypothetical protein
LPFSTAAAGLVSFLGVSAIRENKACAPLGKSEDYAPLELRRRGSLRDLPCGFEAGHAHGTISGPPSVKVKEAFRVVTSDIDPRAAGFELTGRALRR